MGTYGVCIDGNPTPRDPPRRRSCVSLRAGAVTNREVITNEMETASANVVTGAFGYTGKYITQRLLATDHPRGQPVKTLTGHPNRPNPFGDRLSVAPLDFDNPTDLAAYLRGANVLYNTYWVRFPRGRMTYDKAVENTKTLINAAVAAGVARIVHVSITNASADSNLPYFAGKGAIEEAIRSSGLSYAIVRPTVIFGPEDILINNIAWFLRRLPAFGIFGSGEYRLQPVFVEDLAEIAVRAGRGSENLEIDATGPETFTFQELVGLIAETVGSKSRLVHLSPRLALWASRLLGYPLGDVVLTRGEIDGLMANLLTSEAPPAGKTRLTDWLKQNARTVGAGYASELKRHYR